VNAEEKKKKKKYEGDDGRKENYCGGKDGGKKKEGIAEFEGRKRVRKNREMSNERNFGSEKKKKKEMVEKQQRKMGIDEERERIGKKGLSKEFFWRGKSGITTR
jgi:hypothetical protein